MQAFCPKCGAHEFDGPLFVEVSPSGKEALEYACRTCGWKDYRPPLDQQFGAEDLVRRIAEQEQLQRRKRNHTT